MRYGGYSGRNAERGPWDAQSGFNRIFAMQLQMCLTAFTANAKRITKLFVSITIIEKIFFYDLE